MKAKEIAHLALKEIDRNLVAGEGQPTEPGTIVHPYASKEYDNAVLKGMQHGLQLVLNDMMELVKAEKPRPGPGVPYSVRPYREAFQKWQAVVHQVKVNRATFDDHRYITVDLFIVFVTKIMDPTGAILAWLHENHVFGGYALPKSAQDLIVQFEKTAHALAIQEQQQEDLTLVRQYVMTRLMGGRP